MIFAWIDATQTGDCGYRELLVEMRLMSALQRQPLVGTAKRAHDDCFEAALGNSDRRWSEWRLVGVLRS